jgi:hypothetical protein
MRAFPSALAGPWKRLWFRGFAATLFSLISDSFTSDMGTSEGQWIVESGQWSVVDDQKSVARSQEPKVRMR